MPRFAITPRSATGEPRPWWPLTGRSTGSACRIWIRRSVFGAMLDAERGGAFALHQLSPSRQSVGTSGRQQPA